VVYTWSFAAATPSFRCKLYENDNVYDTNVTVLFNRSQPDEAYCKTHMKISVKECQRCYMKTKSSRGTVEIEACENYVFDRTYHDYTLVEELTHLSTNVVMLRYGRRPIISICLLLTACSGFICAFFPQKVKFGFWPSYLAYTLGRFILACTTRGIGVTGFVLATELVGPKNKFLAAIIIHYCFPLGQLILVGFAYFIREWRRLTLTLSIFTIPLIFLYFPLPESVRWMLSKGQYQRAEKVLRKTARINERSFDEEAFQRMKAEQEK
ncbi:unnamed protein product, partial [Didymodactylos carnosus]